MPKFNLSEKLIEYLDVLNHFLAAIFATLTALKFIDLMLDLHVIQAIFESLTIAGIGILTCGYIAIMISVHNHLVAIRNRLEK